MKWMMQSIDCAINGCKTTDPGSMPFGRGRPGVYAQKHQSTSILTFATPASIIPIDLAAALDKSIIRPLTNGPRSFILTLTDLLFAMVVTVTMVPNGSVLCAAVIPSGINFSPLAVIRPCQ